MENTKTRHGCLTAWLILMILANSLTAITTPLLASAIRQNIPGFPGWVVWPISLLALLNVVFAVALFNWKKWGFIGFCATSILALALNLYAGIGVGQSLLGLLGIVILYAVLQIGGEKKGWTHLE
jgi:hypothetical protein